MKTTFLLVCFCLCLSACESSPACPEAADISPCECSVKRRQLYLDCTNVNSQTQFESIFQANFPQKSFSELTIRKSSAISSMDVDYNGVSFAQFRLVAGPFPNLVIDQTIPFPNEDMTQHVTRIKIWRTGMEAFPFHTLPSYPRLGDLEIVNSKIPALPALTSDTLRRFRLESSLLTQFTPDTFAGLPLLKQLNLNRNSLTVLSQGTIPVTPKAFSFNFASNQISSVEIGAFYFTAQNPKLDHLVVDFSYNRLTSIEEQVFSDLMPYVRNLYIFGNPISCDCHIKWLLTNHMQRIPTFGTPKCSDGTPLHEVDLSTLSCPP